MSTPAGLLICGVVVPLLPPAGVPARALAALAEMVLMARPAADGARVMPPAASRHLSTVRHHSSRDAFEGNSRSSVRVRERTHRKRCSRALPDRRATSVARPPSMESISDAESPKMLKR